VTGFFRFPKRFIDGCKQEKQPSRVQIKQLDGLKVSSSLFNPARQKAREVECERLIPGQTASRGSKKPVQSIRARLTDNVTEIVASYPPETREPLALLVPRPLQGRTATSWLRSIAKDFALVALNWLLIGAALVPLRQAFPQIRTFGFASGTPFSLLGIALLHATLITLFGYSEGLYKPGEVTRRTMLALGKSVLLATAILGLAHGLLQAIWTISGLITGAGLFHFAGLYAWRYQGSRSDRTNSRGDSRNVLVIGANGIGRRIASYFEKHPESGRIVQGFLDDEPSGDQVLGRINDLARVARTAFVDEVILAGLHDADIALRVMREARRLRLDVEIVPELFGGFPAETEIEQVGDVSVICLHAERLPAFALLLKRVVDLLGASSTIVFVAPIMLLIALLIKWDSPGSILYVAQRAGLKGRLFPCYKFRTMVSNADAMKNILRQNNQRSGPFFKISDDPRLTRVGRFLRRFSLDELPQLFNVLKGEMSLVGPRPHPLDDVAAYEIEHLARLDVTPGITGLWQVKARRNPSFQRGMELDREYIRKWSLGMDLRILLMTFWAVVKGSGD
jgi:exopolysaccharide biosynthesis polyprenyl glycosylphosphotransferase